MSFQSRARRSSVISGLLSDSYQKLVLRELDKLRSARNDFTDPTTFLNSEELELTYSDANRLIKEGLLVKFDDDKFRTAHGDLLFRIVNIRNLEAQHPIPFEFKLLVKEELVPDFDTHRFESVIPQLIPETKVAETVLGSLRSNPSLKGLSSYQLPMTQQILKSTFRNVAVVAPTASGKTLTFFLPCFTAAVKRAFAAEVGVSSVMIYPRRALERDQMRFLLSIIDTANQMLWAAGVKPITIGLDDSDTPKRNQIRDGDSFCNLKCTDCQSPLAIKLVDSQPIVKCKNCSKTFSYILPTKEMIWESKPTILITNVWTIYRRLLSPRTVDIFKGLDFVVLDEAHVYTHYLGGHVSYIVKLLRLVASEGKDPSFVFASATIPNPEQFLCSLAGAKEDEMFYLDFGETLRKAGNVKSKRLLIHLYLLPHPASDIETMTEALVLATTLWCHKHHWRSLAFIDSIAEINTMNDYFQQTILGEREGREVTDHVFSVSTPGSFNTYDWTSLSPSNHNSDLKQMKKFVLSDYKRSIGMHYGGLSLDRRAMIEGEFAKGSLRTLLSTSTLELGIDLSEVAVVIQHKLPMTPEGVVQRIGRAGRSPECYRIALGIIALPSLPLSTLYMFDDRLRQRLEDVSSLAPLRLGQTSDNLLLQYTLSLLLLERAKNKKSTYIDIEKEGLKSRSEIPNMLVSLLDDLKQLPAINKKAAFFSKKDLNDSSQRLTDLFKKMIGGIEKLANTSIVIDDSVEQLQSEIASNLGRLYDASEMSTEFLAQIQNVKEISEQDLALLSSLPSNVRKVSGVLHEVNRVVNQSVEQEEPRIMQIWLNKNAHRIQNEFSSLPSSDVTMEMSLRFMQELSKIGNKNFKQRYALDANKILLHLTALGDSFGSGDDDKILAFLNKIPARLAKIGSTRFDALSAARALDRFENEAKHELGGKMDLFKVLSVLFEGKAHFSLLLESPSPDIELIGTEEL